MESIRVRKSRRKLEDGSLCPHVQLVFRLSSLLGLSPLVFENGESRFSYPRAVYSIIILCITLFFGFLNFEFVLYFFNDVSLLIIALLNIAIYISLPISSVIDTFRNVSDYGHIFEELRIIDSQLSAIGVLKVHRQNWSTWLLEILMISIYFIITLPLRWDFAFFFHCIGMTTYALVCCQLKAVGRHILSRYDLVVHTLDQLKNTQHNN
ncbi:unnamed protein product [Nezara viridula]|uniref:Uncharacterized protein n=1 Tax=Nezara viridula TaxID=85310 RepID=A0A9P0H953_NEZVI|nr:unnamed protein product [Nezara viridula]